MFMIDMNVHKILSIYTLWYVYERNTMVEQFVTNGESRKKETKR